MAPRYTSTPPSTPASAYALFLILPTLSICQSATGCFESIISFGDSLADTGNLLRLRESSVVKPRCSRLPYGETFFHRPNGRYSDGRLVVDFIAESFGLPLVQPYVGGENSSSSGQSFEKGVNFAVAGATSLDHKYLEKRGIYNPTTNVSLGVQMDWLKQFLGTLPEPARLGQVVANPHPQICFGDSLADTGNLLRLSESSAVKPRCSRLPYGETFFHRPNGRYSDGRLVVDFIAESFGLPLVKPYVDGENSTLSGQSFEKGVNFAVAGATSLDHKYLE